LVQFLQISVLENKKITVGEETIKKIHSDFAEYSFIF